MQKTVTLTNKQINVVKAVIEKITGKKVNEESVIAMAKSNYALYVEGNHFTLGLIDEVEKLRSTLDPKQVNQLKVILSSVQLPLCENKLYLIHLNEQEAYNIDTGLNVMEYIEKVLNECLEDMKISTLTKFLSSFTELLHSPCECEGCKDNQEDEENISDPEDQSISPDNIHNVLKLILGEDEYINLIKDDALSTLKPEEPIKLEKHELTNLINVFDEYNAPISGIEFLLENGYYEIEDNKSGIIIESLTAFEYVKKYEDEEELEVVLENASIFDLTKVNCAVYRGEDSSSFCAWSLDTGEDFVDSIYKQVEILKSQETERELTREEQIEDLFTRFSK